MDRTNQIEDILSNEDFKNQLIKEVYDKEVEQAGSLSGNPEVHLSGYLKEIDEKRFEDIYRTFIENCSYTLNKRVPSTNGEKDKKDKTVNDDDSVKPEKELKAMNDLTVETASLATGITVGSGNENVTDVLDSTHETDVASNDEEANLPGAVINEHLEGIGMEGDDIAIDNVDGVASPVEEDGDGIGDNVMNVENHEVVSEISDTDSSDSVSSHSRARELSSSPQAVANHGCTATQPHVCHPVCGTCEVSMDRFNLLEMFNLQNITLTREKLALHQQALKQGKDVASFKRKLKETVKLLQSKEHDCDELGKINLYFRKKLNERNKKIEDFQKENGVLRDKCKLSEEALQVENILRENLNDISNLMEQVTEMIGTSQDENRALCRENQELREQKQCLISQLAIVTENATREWSVLWVFKASTVQKLKEIYGYLKTFAERYGLRLPIWPSAPMEE